MKLPWQLYVLVGLGLAAYVTKPGASKLLALWLMPGAPPMGPFG